MFVWLDLETTGLEPEQHAIIEVGVILTDDQLVEKARFQHYVTPPAVEKWDPFCVAMHKKSGLYDRAFAEGRDVVVVASMLLEFLFRNDVSKKDYLAGNSIHFDRSFLQEHMSEVLRHLHYRMVDVSSLKVLAGLWCPETPYPQTEKAHTAIADLEHTLREFTFWRALLFKDGIGPHTLTGSRGLT